MAADAIDSGRAAAVLERLVRLSNAAESERVGDGGSEAASGEANGGR
jgi:hypothetical protein